MNGLDYWRICDELSVIQAALLIVCLDPGEDGVGEYVEGWDAHNRPPGYDAAKSSLINSILRFHAHHRAGKTGVT